MKKFDKFLKLYEAEVVNPPAPQKTQKQQPQQPQKQQPQQPPKQQQQQTQTGQTATTDTLSVKNLMTVTGYVDVVKKLQELTPDDPKTANFLKSLEGDPANDTIKVDFDKVLPVSVLIPTQNEIDFSKSLNFCLAKEVPTKAFVSDKNKPVDFGKPLPLIVAEIGGINYIIDGHHRWSQIFICNPNASMTCHIINGFKDPILALKAVQMSIAKAILNKQGGLPTATTDPNAINLLNPNVTQENFKASVKKTIQGGEKKDEILAAFANFKPGKYPNGLKGDNEDGSISVIGDYLWSNILLMREKNKPINNAPSREVMPQTAGGKSISNTEVDLNPTEDVLKPLEAGKVNVNPSFESNVMKFSKFISERKKLN
jgi:hypothetical protein